MSGLAGLGPIAVCAVDSQVVEGSSLHSFATHVLVRLAFRQLDVSGIRQVVVVLHLPSMAGASRDYCQP